MMRLLAVFLSGFFCTGVANAAKLSTDLLVFVPKNVVQTLTGQVAGTFQYSAPALTIPGSYPINLVNLDLSLSYRLKSLNLKNKGAFDAGLEFVKVRARAAELHIDAFTEQVVNGVIVRVKVKVDCTNAVMENRTAIPAAGSGSVSNLPLSAKFDLINWTASGQEWMFSAEKCEGDVGAAQLEAQINSFFSTSAELKKDVVTRANQLIASWFEKNRNWSRPFPDFNSVISTRADEIIDNGNSWVLRLGMQMTPLMNCPAFEKEPTVPAPPTAPGPEGIEMQMSVRTATLIAQCLHEMGHLYRRDLASDMNGFKDFMGSWLKKFMYWGDLLRFPNNAEFIFLSRTMSDFSFEPRPVKENRAEKKTRIDFDASGTIESQMKYLSGEGDPSPYVTFYTQIAGIMSLETQFKKTNEPTIFTLKARNDPSSRLTYKWNVAKEILKDEGINTNAINDELMKTLGSSKLQFALDPAVMTESHQMNVVGLKSTDGLIQLQLQVNPRVPAQKDVEVYLTQEPSRSSASPIYPASENPNYN